MLKKEKFHVRARFLNRARKSAGRLKATMAMTDMVLKFSQESLRAKKPFILTTIWCPSEILYALDIIPINAETVATSLAGFGLSDDFLAVAEKNFHSPETCSVLRCAVGAVIDRLFPEPSAVLATTHLCDAGAKMVSTASLVYDCEYFLIDIPQERGEEAVDYVAEQLEEMAVGLSDITGQKLKKEKLSRAIELSNQARYHALRANELRRAVPSPMRGSEAIGYLYMIGIGFGSPEAEAIYKHMAQELERRVAKKYSPIGEERKRLLWLHIKPFFRTRFFQYLEKELKVAIAFEEINHIFWPELDPSRPFRSVAQKLVYNIANEPIESYIGTILNLAKKYRVDGVLHFGHWGCRWNYGRMKIVKETFQKKGIPFLTVDCDSVSQRNYFEGQLNNQIDSFMDMLS